MRFRVQSARSCLTGSGPLRSFVLPLLAWIGGCICVGVDVGARRGRGSPARAHTGAVGRCTRRLPCGARGRGASHNSLRALRALRSNKCDENDDEARCARRPCRCAPRRSRNRPRRAAPAATLGFWCSGCRGPDFPAKRTDLSSGRGGWLHRAAGRIRACRRGTRPDHRGRASPMVCSNGICASLQAARCGRPARWPWTGSGASRLSNPSNVRYGPKADARLRPEPHPFAFSPKKQEPLKCRTSSSSGSISPPRRCSA